MQELLDHGAKTVLLGTGFYERLKVQPATLRMLEEKGIGVHVCQSEEVRWILKKFRGKAGVPIHSTC